MATPTRDTIALEGHEPFTQIDTLILRCGRLPKEFRPTPTEVQLYAILKSYAYDGTCFPGIGRLADDLGIAERNVPTHITRLEELGFIRVMRSPKLAKGEKGRRREVNHYIVIRTLPEPLKQLLPAVAVVSSDASIPMQSYSDTSIPMNTDVSIPMPASSDASIPNDNDASIPIDANCSAATSLDRDTSIPSIGMPASVEEYEHNNTNPNYQNNNNNDGSSAPYTRGRRGRDDEVVDVSGANHNDDSLAPSSRGRRDEVDEPSAIPNNDNASSPIPRAEDAGLNPNSPLPSLSEEEQSRYQLAERRLRSHYDIPPSRSPSPPTVRLLLELAREFTEAETTHIFDVVDREKDRSAGVPPRQQYLRTTMANVKREREGGEEDERAAQGRPRPHGAAIRGGGGSGAAATAAGREPAGLKELREQVRAMRASGGGFARSGRSTNW